MKETLDLNIHGTDVSIEADSLSFIKAIRQMLYYFVKPSGKIKISSNTLRFLLYTVDSEKKLEIAGIPDKPASVSGEMEYFFSYPFLFTRIKGKFVTVTHLQEKLATCYITERHSKDLWSVAHQVFYPVFSELLKGEGIFDMHCATLSRNRKGYLFPAKSGSGKSTIAFSLLLSNFKFLSDDVTFIGKFEDKLKLLCFPEPVQMWRDTYNFFPKMSKNKNLISQHCPHRKHSFLVDEKFPEQIQESVNPDYLFLPVLRKGKDCGIEEISRKEALVEIIPQSMIIVNKPIVDKQLSLLSKIVAQSQCFRLFLGKNVHNLADILP